VEKIRMAAPMHDVGKVGIPDAILCKAGRLTREEYAIMQRHTLMGAEMLADTELPMLRMAHEIALCHHEHWDGSGYPRGLSAEAIPESARIVAIADVYDALTHDRVYRQALPQEQALAIMRSGQGSHFDPLLLTQFFCLLPELERIARDNPDEGSAMRQFGQPEADDRIDRAKQEVQAATQRG
jgi:putative two-component system response regulator